MIDRSEFSGKIQRHLKAPCFETAGVTSIGDPVDIPQSGPPLPGRSWTDMSAPVPIDVQQPDGIAGASDDPEEMEYQEALFNAKVWLSVFEEQGKAVKPNDTILDFGCGTGKMVYAFRQLGYMAFGTDIVGPSAEVERRMRQEELCRLGETVFTVINYDAYRIPFESNHFDYVVSWNVLEHVADHSRAFAEVSRVLKSGGSSLHFFPSRYRILEPHVHVPLATLFQGYTYLYLWAWTGIRTKSQNGLTAEEVAWRNHQYLRNETKYLTERELMQLVNRYFADAEFVERHFWKYLGGKSGFIYNVLSKCGLPELLPTAASLLSRFGYRALSLGKPR